jgi:TolB-like protein
MIRRMRVLALLAALAAATPSTAFAQAKPKIAVLDFTAVGASKELASAAGGIAANELDRMATFQIVTADAIRNMLAFEKQRQMLGCADAGCMAEIGGALGVDWLVSGKVTKLAASPGVPETFSLDLTLTNVKKAQREGSVVDTARTETELVQKTGKAAQKLVARILAGRTGKLVVSLEETGAVVKVDDQAKGTTPLRGPIVLPAGPHALAVEKKGFVAWQKDVQVEAGKVVEERVALVPSPDFVKEYESRQKKLRLGAWISTGVAVAGLAAAVALQASANSLYGNESTPGTFLYDRARLQAGIETQNGVDLRAEANQLKSDIESRETASYVAAGVGGVAAIAATYFWIAGEDPKRYAGFAEPTARIDVAPLPGGAIAAATVRF